MYCIAVPNKASAAKRVNPHPFLLLFHLWKNGLTPLKRIQSSGRALATPTSIDYLTYTASPEGTVIVKELHSNLSS